MPFNSRTLFSDGMERQLISFIIAHLLVLPDHWCKSVCLANSIVESFGIVSFFVFILYRMFWDGFAESSMDSCI